MKNGTRASKRISEKSAYVIEASNCLKKLFHYVMDFQKSLTLFFVQFLLLILRKFRCFFGFSRRTKNCYFLHTPHICFFCTVLPRLDDDVTVSLEIVDFFANLISFSIKIIFNAALIALNKVDCICKNLFLIKFDTFYTFACTFFELIIYLLCFIAIRVKTFFCTCVFKNKLAKVCLMDEDYVFR